MNAYPVVSNLSNASIGTGDSLEAIFFCNARQPQ